MKSNAVQILLGLLITSFVLSAKCEVSQGTFEIIDLSGDIAGEPQLGADRARSSWLKACQDWKKETKELSKANEILLINCNTPSCSTLENGKNQCVSSGSYKLKTSGSQVATPQVSSSPGPVVQQPSPASQAISAPVYYANPSPIFIETIPIYAPPVWAPTYWGRYHYYHHHPWPSHHGPGLHLEFNQY